LLKGVPKDRLRQDILDGKSITLCYPDFNIYSSAIVTGSIPISVGVALDKKLKNEPGHVWCFVGDMASETGTFFENWKYAVNHDLPITFVVEDNNKSVCTNTRKVWNASEIYFSESKPKVLCYQYQSKYPHAGAGKRIQF
jgi:TPP-dependent pyruvate/acetoin dehydrogenase alpha subunit